MIQIKTNIYSKTFSYWVRFFSFILLKYQFWKKSLRKNVTLVGWTLSQHICLYFWAWLLLYSAITPKCEDKYVQKCSTCQSFIFPKWHSFKIGTLVSFTQIVCPRSALPLQIWHWTRSDPNKPLCLLASYVYTRQQAELTGQRKIFLVPCRRL